MSESEEEKYQPNLTVDIIRKNLMDFHRTVEGNAFAFTRLELDNREMETLCKELANYEHLRVINFSGNKLGNIDIISKIPNVMHLDVHGNMLSKLDIFTNEELFTNLRYLDISRNRFKNLPALKLPKLV